MEIWRLATCGHGLHRSSIIYSASHTWTWLPAADGSTTSSCLPTELVVFRGPFPLLMMTSPRVDIRVLWAGRHGNVVRRRLMRCQATRRCYAQHREPGSKWSSLQTPRHREISRDLAPRDFDATVPRCTTSCRNRRSWRSVVIVPDLNNNFYMASSVYNIRL